MPFPPPAREPKPWLRRLDQAAVAVLTLLGLVSFVCYWLIGGGVGSGWIELERTRAKPAQFWVDVNQADWPELAELPEVGEGLARRIVETRSARGPYSEIVDLRRVPGLGPRTLEKIKPYLRPIPPAKDVVGK